MKKISISDIDALNPCYSASKFLVKGWKGTAIDILKIVECPAQDRLWVVTRSRFMTLNQLRVHGLQCARLVEHLSKNPAVKHCNDVNERFLSKSASADELKIAAYAAYAAYAAAVYAYAAYAADAAGAAADAAAYAAADADAGATAREIMRETQVLILIDVLENVE